MTSRPNDIVLGQPSWRLSNGDIDAWVTHLGGHVGPVTFRIGDRRVEPYAVAPWAEEEPGDIPPILQVLRGDFFCLPFGANEEPARGEHHPPHGETANQQWEAVDRRPDRLHLTMETSVRPGHVDKIISIRDGHAAVYSRHILSGMTGPMSFGHHAMLRFPEGASTGLIATSPFVFGQTAPEPVERPENRGYSILEPGSSFTSLDDVPTVTGAPADLSRYPARRGFEDLVMLVSDVTLPFSWTSVTFPGEGYVWFALKDPGVLHQTIFWISNGGRHYPPWNGRHVNVMGLEEVTSYFHYGLAASIRPNPVSERGWPTSIDLDPTRPLDVRYVAAVAGVPDGFDHVASITPVGAGEVLLRSRSGQSARVRVDHGFLSNDDPFFPAATQRRIRRT